MFCNNCGAKLVDGAMFCNVCGNKIDIDQGSAKDRNNRGNGIADHQVQHIPDCVRAESHDNGRDRRYDKCLPVFLLIEDISPDRKCV